MGRVRVIRRVRGGRKESTREAIRRRLMLLEKEAVREAQMVIEEAVGAWKRNR